MSNLGVSWTTIFQDAKDIYGRDLDEATLIRRANRLLDELKLIVNLPTQIRQDYISYIYQFSRYKLPTDYKTEGKISLRYDDQINNDRDRTYTQEEPPFLLYNNHWTFHIPEEWNQRNSINIATIVNNKGVEKLWLANGRASQTSQEISVCESLTGWVGASGAGNLTLDSDVKVEGNYSINFDLTSATAATLTLTLTTGIDLTEYVNAGKIRLFNWLPTSPSSIDIQIGDDSSNYYTQNLTAQADGDIFDTSNLNELEFSFKDATQTGNPTMSSCLHFKIIFNFSSAITDTDFRIDNIKAWKPEQLVFEYYSYYMVKTLAGVWQEAITTTPGTDDIILIIPEWRTNFGKKLLLEDLIKNSDKRYDVYLKETDKWWKEIQKRYPNLAKRTGNSWY